MKLVNQNIFKFCNTPVIQGITQIFKYRGSLHYNFNTDKISTTATFLYPNYYYYN